MFSLRFMSNGSHTFTAGEELVEWEAVKNHGSSAAGGDARQRDAALDWHTLRLPALWGSSSARACSSIWTSTARSSGAGGAGIGTGSGSLAEDARPAPQMEILPEVQPRYWPPAPLAVNPNSGRRSGSTQDNPR